MNDQVLPKWLQAVFLLLPVLLIVLFVGASYWQVKDVSDGIMARERADLSTLWSAQPGDSALTAAEYASLVKWRALVAMEHEAIAQRYEQGGILVVSRITTKYLGFLTGMIMAIAGAIFIVGRIKEGESTAKASLGDRSFSLRSTSPGIFFGALGTVLMALTINQHTDIGITDTPLYLHPTNTYLLDARRDTRSDAAFMNAMTAGAATAPAPATATANSDTAAQASAPKPSAVDPATVKKP